ncbi:MAG: cation:proton antiporter [Opitutales bacterium]|nr:cation:proton antiporter [Opitutales bacterium]
MSENYLVKDLTTIVVIAGLVSIVFSILRWPNILGYLVAGVIVGPYLTANFSVHDQTSIQNISELGVIFLMFCIGLEFDLKKLKQTLFPSLLAMFFQALMAFFIGTTVAGMIGWDSALGVFLGAIFAVSSTMVAIPIIKQQNAMQQPFAQFTMGIAILEDVFAVVLLVILSNLRQGGFHFSQCLNLVFWITVFIASVLIFGRLAAQRFLHMLGKIQNPEIVHLCVAGLILLLSEISSGYSNALGAFLAGAIFANTHVIHRLENMIAPIRDIFTAVFFVSIGMLINPHLLWEYKGLILLLSVLVVVGQFSSVWFGFFLSGQKPSVAFRASLPKSQIGEFSFVIASLAHALGLDDGQLMAITVGVSLFSIVAVNILCMREDALLEKCTQRVPRILKTWCTLYQNLLLSIQTHVSGNKFLSIIQKPLLKIVLHFFLINAIVWCNYGLCTFLEQNPIPGTEDYGIWIQRALLLVTIGLALPFISCVVRNLNLIIMSLCKQSLRKLFVRLNQHAALYKIFQLIVTAIAIFIFVWIFMASSSKYLPNYIHLVVLLLIGIGFGVGFWRNLRNLNSHFELMFLESFSEELENENERRRQAMIKMVENKHPWEIKTLQTILPENSHLIGRSLTETQWNQQTHTLLIGVSRGGFFSDTVPPTHVFYPGDILLLLGNKKQLSEAVKWVGIPQKISHARKFDFDFEQLILTDRHPFVQETVASIQLRQRFGVNLVGIQRKEQRMEEISPNDIFKIGDCLLLVGPRKNLEAVQSLSSIPHSLTPAPTLTK